MRFFYDCGDERARQRLASTIFFFLLALERRACSPSLLVAAPRAGRALLGDRAYTPRCG